MLAPPRFGGSGLLALMVSQDVFVWVGGQRYQGCLVDACGRRFGHRFKQVT
jgi:hypothetical protein